MIHELKTWPTPFQAVADGRKEFELRKDDRGFEIGDEVLLREFTPADYWDPEEPKKDEYSGKILHRRIKYLLRNFDGIKKGYCILGLEKI
jgi:hypothetical protein